MTSDSGLKSLFWCGIFTNAEIGRLLPDDYLFGNLETPMNYSAGAPMQTEEKTHNLRAIFEILAYLQVDANRDGFGELADRLGFAMNHAEQQLNHLKNPSTVAPVNTAQR